MAMTFTTTGITVTPTTSSVSYTLPVNSAGQATTKFVRVIADGIAFIKVGLGTVVASTNDMMIDQYLSEILEVNGPGFTTFAVIKPAGSTATMVNLIALENQSSP